MWLEGGLEDMTLLQVLQLFLMTNQKGRLEVFGKKRGSLYFKNRNITYADYGGLKGEAAVKEILKLQKGRFRFDSRARLPKEEYSLPLQEMILEATREMDEWKEIKKIVPSFDTIPRILVSPEGDESMKFTPKEWKILSQIDGKSSVTEIAHRCGLSKSEVARVIFRMAQAQILKTSLPEKGKGIFGLLKRKKSD